MSQNIQSLSILIFVCFFQTGCKKLVEIPEPTNTITSNEAFASDATATSALMGIYSNMSWAGGTIKYANGAITQFTGLSADELNYFYTNNTSIYEFQSNGILASNNNPNSLFWTPLYADIYNANAVLEGLNSSTSVSELMKKQLIGEAKFIRAFNHLYLVNLFGDVPLITTTSWSSTALQSRTPSVKVYEQIISDLKDAENLLHEDYSISNLERIRPNKWAAKALLARVYLYTQNFTEAERKATEIINETGLFTIIDDLSSVFLKNSKESIWQLQVLNVYPFATGDANRFVPFDTNNSPQFYLSAGLVDAFDSADKRKESWTQNYDFSGTTYFYPFKYKVRESSVDNVTEYYTVLRFAEQYLIRAESRAVLNNLSGAVEDLNVLRRRAGLTDLPTSLTQEQILAANTRERRVELFAEWGHRWLDLKRTGQADAVLSSAKSQWQSTAKLYPIPLSELKVNHNLVQNPGY